ncbi:DUF2855 family protein [Sphaerisporangium corydalis]|uniref:DUF2855 family protein n=1 Tax=Sphaerisporangium corydalis TaxID=1441875 RepID=A0ABV9ED24_9ACTN|nr:DUF2855 family protein [Sphaerisporangium corydalis]
MPQPDRWDLVFKRDDLTVAEVLAPPRPRLKEGEVGLAVESFGLTTNNVTYARFVEPGFSYWDAFPGPDGYGRVPIWGFARVEESRHPDVAVGDRYYGFMPMSSHHVVAPGPSAQGFADTTERLHYLPPWYWTYQPAGEPDGRDDRRAVVRAVYPAVFNLAGLAERQAALGARSVLVTSASSKVAIGLAQRLASQGSALATIGVTSEANRAFVEGLGLYGTVISYGDLPSLSATGPVVFVDLTGDAGRLSAVYDSLAGDLCHTVQVGFTHPGSDIVPPPLPGPQPEFFFTPLVEAQAIEEEGAGPYQARYTQAEDGFVDSTASWLTVRRAQGPEAVAEVFAALLDGKQPPDVTYVFRP